MQDSTRFRETFTVRTLQALADKNNAKVILSSLLWPESKMSNRAKGSRQRRIRSRYLHVMSGSHALSLHSRGNAPSAVQSRALRPLREIALNTSRALVNARAEHPVAGFRTQGQSKSTTQSNVTKVGQGCPTPAQKRTVSIQKAGGKNEPKRGAHSRRLSDRPPASPAPLPAGWSPSLRRRGP